jgi:hypothetical protein
MFGRGITLRELVLQDAKRPEDCYLYKLAQRSGAMNHFKVVVLMSSTQDGCVSSTR